MAYAERTEVSPEKSRNEIERVLARYGASSFAYGNTPERAVVMFEANNRRVRFEVPMPDPQSKEMTRDRQGYLLNDRQRQMRVEQATRQRWRALCLTIKAKLEAVDSKIVSFEQEFGMHIILPNGRTVFQEVQPAIDRAYESGQMPKMLEHW